MQHGGGLQHAQHCCAPPQAATPTPAPPSSLAPHHLPRSPPHRTPAAAGLQPRRGPAVLPAAPARGPGPAASGKGCPCPAVPGAQLPVPRSAQPWLPITRQLGLCFHSGAFPRASGHGEGTGARAGDALVQGQTLCPRACGEAGGQGHTLRAVPPRCPQQGTEPWQSFAGDMQGGRTEKAIGSDPALNGMPGAPQLAPQDGAGQAGGGLRAPQPLFCSRKGPGARGWGDGPTSTAAWGELSPPEQASPKHSPESSGRRGSLGVSLAPHPALLLDGKFGPSRMGQRPRRGPVLPQPPSPSPASSTERERAAAAGASQSWPHPQPCLGGLHIHRAQTCLGNTGAASALPRSHSSSALQLTGAWEPRCGEEGARWGCTSPQPAKPSRALQHTFGGKREGGQTLGCSSTQVWLHHFVLQPKPSGDAKPTL